MKPFDYQRPSDAEAAITLVDGHPNAAFLGAGTNVVDHLKLGIRSPELLVDVSGLPHDRIEAVDGGVRIGAAVSNSDVAAHPLIRQKYPVLSQALLAGASGQLRNLATTGGNLLQRTRCSYFQDLSTPCNKRTPGTGCSAREGDNRYHAILGASAACVATHPSDMAVAMTLLDTVVDVQGPAGSRQIPVDELYRAADERPEQDTVLDRAELITSVTLPDVAAATRSAYRKVRDRASYAFALVSVAACLTVREDTVADVRIAFGGLAHKPWRARRAEEQLRVKPATEDAFRAAADAELAEATPLEHNQFKIPLARNTLVSVLSDLV